MAGRSTTRARPSCAAGDVRSVAIARSADDGECRLLLTGNVPVHLLEFDGLPSQFLDYFEHDGFEIVHVVAGNVEIDVGGELSELAAGDSIAYSSGIPHRLRSAGAAAAGRVMLFEAAWAQRAGDHSSMAPAP